MGVLLPAGTSRGWVACWALSYGQDAVEGWPQNKRHQVCVRKLMSARLSSSTGVPGKVTSISWVNQPCKSVLRAEGHLLLSIKGLQSVLPFFATCLPLHPAWLSPALLRACGAHREQPHGTLHTPLSSPLCPCLWHHPTEAPIQLPPKVAGDFVPVRSRIEFRPRATCVIANAWWIYLCLWHK